MDYRSGSADRSACFYGSHRNCCPNKYAARFSPETFDRSDFKFGATMDAILARPGVKRAVTSGSSMHKAEKEVKMAARNPSLKSLFACCKYYDSSEIIGCWPINRILVDYRSAELYSRGILDKKIVEAKPANGYFTLRRNLRYGSVCGMHR